MTDNSAVEPKLGEIYVHYKGGTYEIVDIAVHHDTRAKLVVYRSRECGELNVRPLLGTPEDPDGWMDPTTSGQARFIRVFQPGAPHGKFLCPCCDRVLTHETSRRNVVGELVCLNVAECVSSTAARRR